MNLNRVCLSNKVEKSLLVTEREYDIKKRFTIKNILEKNYIISYELPSERNKKKKPKR